MNDIKCKVKKCYYNENDACKASCIEVCNCNCHQADHKDQTECATFKMKEL